MPGMQGSKRDDGRIFTMIGRSRASKSDGRNAMASSKPAGTSPTGVCSASMRGWDTGIIGAKMTTHRAVTTLHFGDVKEPHRASLKYSSLSPIGIAEEQGLWFWISERPAWHYPRGVCFIEWAHPESRFAALRATPEADAWMRTIHAWKGEEILPGPGNGLRWEALN